MRIIKEQLELAVRMAEVVRATSEWHRRMTSENLSQSGQKVDLERYIIGQNAYLYKPPSMNETITRGRRAKHIDHYVGPGVIMKHIGTRSVEIRYQGKDFQRDAGMVMLEKPRFVGEDPTIANRAIIGPQLNSEASRTANPLQEGEFVIMKDDPGAVTWYCAEVRKLLADRIEVNYYTTVTPALEEFQESTHMQREERLKEAHFLRTWCLDRGKGLPTTIPPATNHGRMKHLWWGRIPLEDIDRHVLIRGVGLSALGKLDRTSRELASKLDIPHHEGAGGEEDFVDNESFQKHVRRVSTRLKRKR
jgi:hypothetical protein